MQMIYMGADHAGFKAKNQLKAWLSGHGYDVDDLGAHALESTDDYPAYAFAVAERVAANPGSLGILLCANGQGMCIAANKVEGVRAVSSWDPEHAASTRTDDDANVLCLAAKYLDQLALETVVQRWLEANASQDERHVRRRELIRRREHG